MLVQVERGGDHFIERVRLDLLIALRGIPEEAHRYQLGSRSAIEWLSDRYYVRTDKPSGIVNDPNTYSDDPRYIIDLMKRVVTVSVGTMRVVEALPELPLGTASAEG